jgi:hypothetical protein
MKVGSSSAIVAVSDLQIALCSITNQALIASIFINPEATPDPYYYSSHHPVEPYPIHTSVLKPLI